MQQKYTKAKRKKVITFSVGDFVSVRIPRIDRSSTDFHRVVCIVVEKLGQKFHLYRLRYAMHDIFYYTCVTDCCSCPFISDVPTESYKPAMVREIWSHFNDSCSFRWRDGRMTEYYLYEKQHNSSTPRMSTVQAVVTASQGVVLIAASANRKEQHALPSVMEGKAARMSAIPPLVPV